ncbi:hypothetical protein D3C78_1947280 [compost metagenome]
MPVAGSKTCPGTAGSTVIGTSATAVTVTVTVAVSTAPPDVTVYVKLVEPL